MKVYNQKDAVSETVKLLKQNGFLFLSKSDHSCYLIRRDYKVRVSDHRREHVEDCDRDIVFLSNTILPDINYRVSLCKS